MEQPKKYIVDFHTHILPGMDDGASDPKESLAMLSFLAAQSAYQVFLTPHFVLHRESLSSFLQRRETAAAELVAALKAAGKNFRVPRLCLGAEVRLEQELVDVPDIKELCYAGTNALLLEFPFQSMERRHFETLENIVYKYKIIPVIAHLDRYLDLFNGQDIGQILTLPNVVIQFNASVFESFSSRRFALSLMREGARVVLGSDGHNLEDRPPKISEAYKVLARKLDEDSLRNFYRTMKYFTSM